MQLIDGYRCAPPILQIKSQLAAPPNQSARARTNAPSEGRVESLCRGASRMDAARGVKGQGRPLYAGPWSNDGAREPDEVGPDARGKTSWLLLGRLPEVTRRKGGTNIRNAAKAAHTKTNPRNNNARGHGQLLQGICPRRGRKTKPRQSAGFCRPSARLIPPAPPACRCGYGSTAAAACQSAYRPC